MNLMDIAKEFADEWRQYWIEKGMPDPSSTEYLALTRQWCLHKGMQIQKDKYTQIGTIFGCDLLVDLSREREPKKRKEQIEKMLRKALGMPEPKLPKYKKA